MLTRWYENSRHEVSHAAEESKGGRMTKKMTSGLKVILVMPARSSPAQQGAAPAQDAAAPAQNSSQFPAGTVIPVELAKSVDSKKAKAGDKIEAKIPMDLLSHGKIVIPKNTKVIGHVTEAK